MSVCDDEEKEDDNTDDVYWGVYWGIYDEEKEEDKADDVYWGVCCAMKGGLCEKNSDDCMPCHKSWINRRIPTNRKIPTNITAGDQTKDFFFNQFAVTKILYQRFPSQEYSAVIMLSVIKLFGFLVEKTLVTGILSDSRFGLHYSGLS